MHCTNNNGIETAVVVFVRGQGDHLTVSGGTFTNNGKTFQAKSMSCNMTDGVANITVTSSFSDEYKNVSMTLTVYGEEIPFDLENFRNNAQSVAVGINPTSAEIVVIKGNSSAVSITGDMKIYLGQSRNRRSAAKGIAP